MQAAPCVYGTGRPTGRTRVQRRMRMAALPELVPVRAASPLGGILRQFGIAFDTAAIREESTDFRCRPERHDPIARLTVYALNAAVMVFFFPLGFALLIFNILGGENLRTTAHVLALTGFGMALAAAGFAAVLPAGF